ncbi:MAG: orotate phosphoribosyltransferase [Verrucomicrobiota bacterium]|nr:orotate phosphoribosyltransferase [Verrucomicrobiota bacterium]
MSSVTKEEILQIFRNSGALLEGHFILRSGLRSRQFFQCALALQDMPSVERLGEALAGKLRNYSPVTVLAPAMGGLVIGQEVARQLGVRFIFAEKEDDVLVMRRGFEISPNERIVIVEDVVTKGGRVSEAVAIVKKHQAEVCAVGVVVDRSNGNAKIGVPMESLLSMTVETFAADNLPEDLNNVPAVKPGS